MVAAVRDATCNFFSKLFMCTLTVDSEMNNAVEAAVSADLAVHVALKGSLPPHTEVIEHGGALPALKPQVINLYVLEPDSHPSQFMSDILAHAYGSLP